MASYFTLAVIPSVQISMSLLFSSEIVLVGERLKPLPLGEFLQTELIRTARHISTSISSAFARRACLTVLPQQLVTFQTNHAFSYNIQRQQWSCQWPYKWQQWIIIAGT
jgi:hypothetical protein